MTQTLVKRTSANAPVPESGSDIYKKSSLATRLCISIRTLENMIVEERVPQPFYLGGASPRWRKADIDAWLEKLASEAQTKHSAEN